MTDNTDLNRAQLYHYSLDPNIDLSPYHNQDIDVLPDDGQWLSSSNVYLNAFGYEQRLQSDSRTYPSLHNIDSSLSLDVNSHYSQQSGFGTFEKFQSLDYTSNNFNMGTTSAAMKPLTSVATTSTMPSFTPIHENTQEQSFGSQQLNSPERPYTCTVPRCKHPNFKDRSGFERHKREVHSIQTFCCPIPTCKRHLKGFNRAYNLFDHTKRCHPQAKSNVYSPRWSRTNPRIQESDGSVSPESAAGEDIADQGPSLEEKLELLRTMRADLDRDIQAMERTMDLLQPAC